MANEIQTARNYVKVKLDIDTTVTDFDDLLTQCVTEAVPRIKPYYQQELEEDIDSSLFTSADGGSVIPVAEGGSTVQSLFVRTSSSNDWQEVDEWRQWKGKIYLEKDITTSLSTKILATKPYPATDLGLSDLESDYPSALLPVYYFAMSEFATYMVGNKRKFNIYQQMNGVRTLSEMQELSDFYEQKAIRILEDDKSAEGR